MIGIKSIEFINHDIFGSQKFDFTKDGNTPIKNIIIAGENGIGKTKFLEELYNISNAEFWYGQVSNSQITHRIVLDISTENYCNMANPEEIVSEAVLTISKNDSGTISKFLKFMNNGVEIKNVKKIDLTDRILSFKMNGLYSSVDINYKSEKNVKGPTDKTIDNDSNQLPVDMAYEIIQLLVNIAIQDACDVDNWVGENKGLPIPDDVYHVRLKRFTNAFKTMFNNSIEFKEIKNNTIPIFKKGDTEIDISSLSSGEKQIIFRGIYLLQNKKSLKGVPIFIDEPELSMHPKWEEKIFNYYKSLFVENSIQTSQMFIATHSEHILEEALNEDDCLIIKLKNNSYETFYKGGSGITLPTITTSEIKYAIFDLYTIDFHTLLYGYIQENYVKDVSGNLINNPTVKQTDNWLITQNVTLKKYRKQISPTLIKDFDTLPTYIRNCIDHPDSSITYTASELVTSIEELITVVRNNI